MQEPLARLMVDAATAAWNTPDTPPGQIERATVQVLAQVPIFAMLSRRHLSRVAGVAAAKRYPPDSPLVRMGTPADAFYVILSGKACVDVPGRRVALEAGDCFEAVGVALEAEDFGVVDEPVDHRGGGSHAAVPGATNS